MERERRGLTVLAAPNEILDIGDASVLEVAVRGVWDAKTFCGSEALVNLVRCGFTAPSALKIFVDCFTLFSPVQRRIMTLLI